jgi:hypothetical protein
MIILIISLIKHKIEWVHPHFLSLKSNMIRDKFISDIKDDTVTSFIDTQPNTP